MSEEHSKYSGSLASAVTVLIGEGHEGPYWDFKLQWHADNAQLVHDIICLANNPTSERAYLIFGVADDSFEVIGILEHPENRKNTQQLIDTLHNVKWATTFPTVGVSTILIKGRELDVVTIDSDASAAPYYLNTDFGKGKGTVRAGAIYTRTQDVNTAKNETATSLVTEQLWRRRFGIDRTPLERLQSLIRSPSDWKFTYPVQERDNEGFAYSYYHTMFPEFTFVRVHNDNKDAYEYPMLISPFFKAPSWWDVRFYYHQTMIYETTGYYSDYLYIAIPKLASINRLPNIRDVENSFSYSYYIDGSINESLTKFELDTTKEGLSGKAESNTLKTVVPTFRSEAERNVFEGWLQSHWSYLDKAKKSFVMHFKQPSIPDGRYKESYADDLVQQAISSAALVRLLKEWRLTSHDSG